MLRIFNSLTSLANIYSLISSFLKTCHEYAWVLLALLSSLTHNHKVYTCLRPTSSSHKDPAIQMLPSHSNKKNIGSLRVHLPFERLLNQQLPPKSQRRSRFAEKKLNPTMQVHLSPKTSLKTKPEQLLIISYPQPLKIRGVSPMFHQSACKTRKTHHPRKDTQANLMAERRRRN